MSSLTRWSQLHSFWYYAAVSGSCEEELLNSFGCRYDLERFGCLPQLDPRQADLLIVGGVVTHKLAPHLLKIYESMASPKYVMVLGACASSGGIYSSFPNDAVLTGVENILPVDVYVAGSPPRPEAIMHGLIQLQEKVRETRNN